MRVLDLWLPILVSGIVTHVMSTIAWTVSPHHKGEWKRLPMEDNLQEMIVHNNLPPEQYIFPFACDGKEANSEPFRAKQAKCTGTLVVWSEPLNMAAAILQTLIFFFITAFAIGYLASMVIPAGATFAAVFKFVTLAGLLAHCFAKFPYVFWFRRKYVFDVLDGVAFAIATGLIFAALWPV